MNSGETRGVLPEGYTDEDLATFREANGIPIAEKEMRQLESVAKELGVEPLRATY